MEPNLSHLSDKMDSFIQLMKEEKAEQKELNANLVGSIAQLSKTVAKIDAFQVEINHQDEKVSDNKHEILLLRQRQSILDEKVITIATLTDDFRQIKKVALAIIVATILGGGYLTKMNNANNAAQNKQLIQAIQSSGHNLEEVTRLLKQKEKSEK